MQFAQKVFAQNLEFFSRLATPASISALHDDQGGPSVRFSDESSRGMVASETQEKWLTIHSPRDPKGEADRQVDAWAKGDQVDFGALIVVVGFGGCYHLRAIAERLEEEGEVLVIEPSASAVRGILERRKFEDMTPHADRFRFSFGIDIDRVGREFRSLLSKRPNFRFFLFVHPGLNRVFASSYHAVFEKIVHQARAQAMDRGTLAYLSDEWQQNTLLNLPVLLRNSGVLALRNLFAGKPAIVVAAGPSLNEVCPILREVNDRALIIAVGTALKPLLKSGIRPHIVIAIDSYAQVLQQFSDVDLGDLHAVISDTVHPTIVERFDNRLFSFSGILSEYGRWIAEFKGYPGLLSVGGTVTVSAIDLAVYCGCDRVTLVGTDLSFKDDGTSHADNSVYHGKRYASHLLRPVPGNYDRIVKTTQQFANYISIMSDYLDEMKKSRGVEVFNANTGGALIRNTTVIKPTEIEQHLGEPTDFTAAIAAAWEAAPRPEEAAVLKVRDRTQLELKAIRRASRRGLKLCRKISTVPPGSEQWNRIIKRLGRCDNQIKSQKYALCLLNGAITAACMHVMSETPAASSEQVEQARRLIESTTCLYQQLEGGADWIDGLLKDAMERYTAFDLVPT